MDRKESSNHCLVDCKILVFFVMIILFSYLAVHMKNDYTWPIFQRIVPDKTTSQQNQSIVAELNALRNIVQERIHSLQDSFNCDDPRQKFLVCRIDWNGGFGCRMHFLASCLQIALLTNRTLVLDSPLKDWPPEAWNVFFQPTLNISGCRSSRLNGFAKSDSTSTTMASSILAQWTDIDSDDRIAHFRMVASNRVRPKVSDISGRLRAVHSEPSAWLYGQYFVYLFRFRPSFEDYINNVARVINFRSRDNGPIVGVHVRRTDKIINHEGGFHAIDEYMRHVDQYFNATEKRTDGSSKRRIFLASDDASAINETKARYRNYKVLSLDDDATDIPNGEWAVRGTVPALRMAILNTYFLARTDFIVCTFSSNFCRLAYEIMQSLHPDDASGRCKSLDKNY